VADIAGVRAFRPRVVPMIYDIWRIVTRGDAWCSPRGCGGRSCGGRRRMMTTGGGRARALAKGGDAGVLQAPGLHGLTRGATAKPAEGSTGPERHRRRAIATAASLPETAFEPNSGVPVGGGRGQGAWSRSWARGGASAAALVTRSAAGQPVHDGAEALHGGQASGGARASVAAIAVRVGDRGGCGSHL
jgi:hypothetical protein